MARILRNGLIGLAAVLALILLLVLMLFLTVNPNDYKPRIIELVQQKKHRTLSIPGEIKLSLFPGIGADLGQVSLSERDSQKQFAQVRHVRLSLALWPLLKKQFVVDKVMVEGVRFELVRDKQGKMNIDDLLSKEPEEKDASVKFDVGSVQVIDGQFLFDDQQQQRRMDIAKFNLLVGRIANGVPSSMDVRFDVKASQPRLDAQVALKTGFAIDMDKQEYLLDGVKLDVNGKLLDFANVALKLAGSMDLRQDSFNFKEVSLLAQAKRDAQQLELKLNAPQFVVAGQEARGDKLTLEGKVTEGKRLLVLDLSLPSFKGGKANLTLPGMALKLGMKDVGLDARATLLADWLIDIDKLLLQSKKVQLTLDGKQGETELAGKLAAQVQIDGKQQSLALNQIAGQFSLPNPHGGAMQLTLDGNAKWDGNRLASLFKGQLDQSHFDARLGVNGLKNPLLDLNLVLDQLDLNQYQPKPGKDSDKANPDPAIDLSPLKTLRLNAGLQVGQLKLGDLQASAVRLDFRADGGKLELAALSANLYGGKIEGMASATASDSPQIHVRQSLSNVALGPLLKDAIKKAPIDGKAQVMLDVTTKGSRVSQLKQALAGSAKMSVQNGAVSGFNLAQIVRNAKSAIGGSSSAAGQSGSSAADDKTDFSELAASFKINAGVAHNDDLSAKSPLFRVTGNGDINLGQDKLDYLVKPTVVATLQGQGGPELQALKGLTVPVRLSGPFSNIGWKIDVASLITDTAKQKVEDKVKETVTDKFKDQLKGLFK